MPKDKNEVVETPETPETPEVPEVPEVEETTASSEPEWRTKQALDLLTALEDPNTAPIIVKSMAERLGLIGGEPQTKAEQKETIRSIKEIVKQKLGDSGAFIANELGDALEEIITTYKNEVTQKIAEVEVRRAQAEFQREYNQAIEELEVTEEEAAELMKLTDEFPWNGKTSIKKYLTNLVNYHRNSATKAAKRAANFSQRTKTLTASANEDQLETVPKKFNSPKEAVEFALRQLKKS